MIDQFKVARPEPEILSKHALDSRWNRIQDAKSPAEAFQAEVRSILAAVLPEVSATARGTERDQCLAVVREAAEHWEKDSPPGASPTKREARAARLLEKAIVAMAAGQPAVPNATYYNAAEDLAVKVIGVDGANVYYSGDANGFASHDEFRKAFVLHSMGDR
ncbi:hypothetical protein [Cupriavidus sp. TMH.W2]|uniref:hypothetical protein n=1 Tax=Cupriavidus sp. TMH.W2 TaxID=3434465 RepID=UPI003D771A4A